MALKFDTTMITYEGNCMNRSFQDSAKATIKELDNLKTIVDSEVKFDARINVNGIKTYLENFTINRIIDVINSLDAVVQKHVKDGLTIQGKHRNRTNVKKNKSQLL